MIQLRPALVLTILFGVFAGLAFPALITVLAQAAFPHQANGSLISEDGRAVGSRLIGQAFSGPRYFHPRPSAAGSGYDGNNSGGTNLGPTHPKLLEGADGFDGVNQLAAEYRKMNGLAEHVQVPADAATRSASGLDPHISPRNAELQIARVASIRNATIESVRSLVRQHTEPPFLGVFGEPRVNVLALNLALDRIGKDR